MKKFLLDLILVLTPIILGAVSYVFVSLVDLNARVISIKELYQETIIRIDKRLERIEKKIDRF